MIEGNGDERRTRWLQRGVETKRKRGQIIYNRWDKSLCSHILCLIFIIPVVH